MSYNNYKKLTVQDIIDYVNQNPESFPKGLDTPVYSGDFECNYTHAKHKLQTIEQDEVVNENSVCLGYEMHENVYDEDYE